MPGLHILCGEYGEGIRQGHVLINHAEQDELDSRVFEALGRPVCLVTPRVGHGVDKMFVDGEHLVGYKSGDVGDAAYRINFFLLEHPELRAHIAATGLAEIDGPHRARHKAEAFTDHVCELAVADFAALFSAGKQTRKASGSRCKHCPIRRVSLKRQTGAQNFNPLLAANLGLPALIPDFFPGTG